MICDVVSVVAITVGSPRHVATMSPRRACLHMILARARREGAVVVDLRPGKGGRVYDWTYWRSMA